MCSQPLSVPLASFPVHRNKKTSSPYCKVGVASLSACESRCFSTLGCPVMWDRTMMHACSCLHGQATKLQDMPEADRTGWAADFADILMSDGTQTVLLPQAVHVLK